MKNKCAWKLSLIIRDPKKENIPGDTKSSATNDEKFWQGKKWRCARRMFFYASSSMSTKEWSIKEILKNKIYLPY